MNSSTGESEDRIEQLLARIFELPASEQAGALSRLCAAHPHLADGLTQGFRNVVSIDDLVSDQPRESERQIGPYRILTVLGEGGMGTVYLAEQREPVRRRVALKVIKLGMDSKHVLARFDLERQALAVMNHAAIAKVFDAGVTELGQPFFVMELVEGAPLTRYCDDHKLSLRDRIEVFRQVCAGVQHAHQKGVLHRDLKPTNILVARRGDEHAVKIIDFGLARATDQQLVDNTIYTERGQLIGTPEYMSPEQASGFALDIDTRTDIYSLGVVLYELLTGDLPFSASELRKAGLVEIQRIISDVDPVRPSTKLSSAGESALPWADRRGLSVPALRRHLRGDLDWITMRAMAKEPERRYESAINLSRDLGRYLAQEPVEAGPPRVTYRLRKMFARHRVSIVATALVFVALIVGVVVAAIGLAGEKHQRSIAEGHARTAESNAELANQRANRIEQQHHEIQRTATRLRAALDREAAQLRATERREYRLRITAAAAALRGHDAAAARRHLEDAPKHLRGWEWEHFQARLDRSERVLRGHRGAVRALTFSPQGRWFATGGEDSTVIVWDADTMEESVRWPRQPGWIVALDACSEGSRLLVTREGHSVALWDVEKRSVIREWRAHRRGPVYAVFSPDGKKIATASRSGPVRVWDTESGEQLCELNGHKTGCVCLAFDHTGQHLVTGSNDRTARVWDVVAKKSILVTKEEEAAVFPVAFLPGGGSFVTCARGVLKVWDATGELKHEVHAHGRTIGGLAVAPDGAFLATAAHDGTVRIWETASGRSVATLLGHTSRDLGALALNPTGQILLSGAGDRTVRVWRMDAADPGTLRGAAAWWPGLAVSAEDATLAESGGRGRVSANAPVPRLSLWDSNGRPLWSRRTRSVLSNLRFGRDGLLVAGGENGRITVMNRTDGERRLEFAMHRTPIKGLELAADGEWGASFSTNSDVVELWNLRDGSARRTIRASARVGSLALHPNGKSLLVGLLNNDAEIWDVESGLRQRRFVGHTGHVVAVAFDPKNERIATGSRDRTLKLWESVDGRPLRTLYGHTSDVWCLAFSPDGKRIVSGAEDAAVKVWDPSTGGVVATLYGYGELVRRVAFSRDGRRIYSKDIGGSIKIWDTEADPKVRSLPERWARVARQLRLTRERERTLYPASPDRHAALQRWLREDLRSLQAQLPHVRQAIESVRARAKRGESSSASPAPETIQTLKKRLATVRRACDVRDGRAAPSNQTVDSTWRTKSASELNRAAWTRVSTDENERTYGEEPLGLAYARLSLAKIEQGDAYGKNLVLDTLAWASFENGLDEAALQYSAAALAAAPIREKREYERYFAQLGLAIRQVRGGRTIADLEAEIARHERITRRLGFARRADQKLHATLTEIAQGIEELGAKGVGRVRERLAWAELVERLTLRHPAARVSWDTVRTAIRAADGVTASELYHCDPPTELAPQIGLVPIGMNPKTKLWEFYHLRSAQDPFAIPTHDPRTGHLAIGGESGVVFVLIPGGKFRMGAQAENAQAPNRDPLARPDESPHEVTLEPFFLARHEITQGQWKRLTAGAEPSYHCPGLKYPGSSVPVGHAHPVEYVSFRRSREMMERHGLILPSEAQWEYACRARTKSPWATGTAAATLHGYANVFDQSGVILGPSRASAAAAFRDGFARTAPVGSLKDNAWGLHDMHGNVREWCGDWYTTYALPVEPGTGKRQGGEVPGASFRSVRGGGFADPVSRSRSSCRGRIRPEHRSSSLGVRAARAVTLARLTAPREKR